MCKADIYATESKSYLASYWQLDEDSPWAQPLNIMIVVWCTFIIILLVRFIYLANRKYDKVTKWNLYDVISQNQTYCIFSAQQLTVLKYMMVFMIIKQIMNIITILLGKSYENYWYSDTEREFLFHGSVFTTCSSWMHRSLFFYLYEACTIVEYATFISIQWL